MCVLVDVGVDLILFVGGDGIVRNVCVIVGDKVFVLGVLVGCKIYFGVYVVIFNVVGEVVKCMLSGELVSVW